MGKRGNDMDASKNRIKSFYEKLFPVEENSIKCFIWPAVILLVLLLIILWISQRTDCLSPNGFLYLKAAPVLFTVVFWPFIIIDNSYRFYRTYQGISQLVDQLEDDDAKKEKKTIELLKWYKKNALYSFTFYRTDEDKKKNAAWHYIGIIGNIIILLVMGCFFALKTFAKLESTWLFAFVVFSAVLCVFMIQQRNLSITLFTVCCGLAYYVYLCYYASDPFQQMFVSNSLNNSVPLIVLAIVFFIAGSAIYPMICSLNAFYRQLPAVIDSIVIEPARLSHEIDHFRIISKYFVHLAMISLVAYFQLFSLVYILGIFDRSVLTIVLFVLGSLFPLLMYCASDIMYKHFMHRQYLQYIKAIHIDEKINDAYKEEKTGTLQQLIALKEKLSAEFEERLNIQVIIALVSPFITTVVSVIRVFTKE